MIVVVFIILLLISLFLAVLSLRKQKKVDELDFVNRELKKKRVIYDYSSSEEESE